MHAWVVEGAGSVPNTVEHWVYPNNGEAAMGSRGEDHRREDGSGVCRIWEGGGGFARDSHTFSKGFAIFKSQSITSLQM